MPSSVLANKVEQAKVSPLITRFTNAGMLLFTEGEIGSGMVAPVMAPDRKTRKPKTFPMKWGINAASSEKAAVLEIVDVQDMLGVMRETFPENVSFPAHGF